MGYDDLDKDTPLYRDLYLCTEFLKCDHDTFLKLPKTEKLKLRTFLDVKMMKQSKSMEDIKDKSSTKYAPETNTGRR